MIFGELSGYRSLNAKQKLFIKNSGIEDSMSVHKWMSFLEPICKFDEKRDAKALSISIAAVVGLAVSCFVVFIIVAGASLWKYGIFLFGVLVLCVYAIYLGIFYCSKDVNNNIRNSLYPLLHMLSLELGNRQKVDLKVNFAKKLRRRERIESMSNSSVHFYSYDVLEVGCNLLDGTRLVWKVSDLVRRKTRKNKIKLKRKTLIHLTFNTDMYALPETVQPSPNDSGVFKVTAEKISFKKTLKQTKINSWVADMDLERLLVATRQPYNYLIRAGEIK